jgi:hypothetical protein
MRSYFQTSLFYFDIDSSCICVNRSQTTKHLFFQCPLVQNLRANHLQDLGQLPSFDDMFFTLNFDQKLDTLFYGHQTFPHHTNQKSVARTATFAGELLSVT